MHFAAGSNDAADVAAAKAAGRIVPCPKPVTIADGLQGRLGDLTWPPVRDLVAGVVTVSDAEIVAAMRLMYERMKASASLPPAACSLLLTDGNLPAACVPATPAVPLCRHEPGPSGKGARV